jgi:beta-glucanase (GH16 family)
MSEMSEHDTTRRITPRIARRSGPLCGLLLLLLGAPLHAQDTLVWSEEFDSGDAPDPAVWSYDLGASGWGNRELQEYTDDAQNAFIENGQLVIRVLEQDSGAPYTSARIRTQDKVMVRYGTIEARVKVPDLADGLWPAFWTLGNNFSEVGWPACGELDILEMGHTSAIRDNVVNRRVGSAAHWENNDNYATYGLFFDAPQRLDDDFHVFKMEWTPDLVRTFVDDNKIWEMRIDSASCTDCTEFHEPHFMILNLAVGGNYTGILTESGITATLPAEIHIDYVRVYDNGFTEVTGPGASPAPIGPAHSGSWNNEDQRGHGFSMEFGNNFEGNPYAVIYWYIYDDTGQPIFMVGQGTPEGNRVEVTFYSPVGMIYGEFDPGAVPDPLDVGGTGVFEFADSDNATFSYAPSEFSETVWGHSTPVENLALKKFFGIPAEPVFPTAR